MPQYCILFYANYTILATQKVAMAQWPPLNTPLLMTSQMRHHNNEKHVESIVQCTTTIQNRFIFSSFLPQLLYLLFQINIYSTKEVQWATRAKRSRIDKIRPSAIGIYENQ